MRGLERKVPIEVLQFFYLRAQELFTWSAWAATSREALASLERRESLVNTDWMRVSGEALVEARSRTLWIRGQR
jgi:hypothetical protein